MSDQSGGFVSPEEPDDDDIDLSAPEGTPEYERAQEEVMIRGAAAASTETEGPLDPAEQEEG
jgi:hypothetical protein